jgi:hypothetical protein
VTGEIITVDDDQVTGTRKALDRARRWRAEESVDRGCAVVNCVATVNPPSLVRINVNVYALRLEYKPGLFDFFRLEATTPRLALDRFSVEITANAPTRDVSGLIDRIAVLSEDIQCCHFREDNEPAVFGFRTLPAHIDVSDDDKSLERRRNGSDALDVWV